MKLSMKAIAPLATAGMLTLSSCNDVDNRANQYLSENNHSMNDYNNIKESNLCIERQSKLDSIAYRDIFNSTQASKDSANVAEFNKIASKMRGKTDKINNSENMLNSIKKKMADANISVKEFNSIEESSYKFRSSATVINNLQHHADDWAYRKFFKKIGIMNDSIAKKCDKISLKIRPR